MQINLEVAINSSPVCPKNCRQKIEGIGYPNENTNTIVEPSIEIHIAQGLVEKYIIGMELKT